MQAIILLHLLKVDREGTTDIGRKRIKKPRLWDWLLIRPVGIQAQLLTSDGQVVVCRRIQKGGGLVLDVVVNHIELCDEALGSLEMVIF